MRQREPIEEASQPRLRVWWLHQDVPAPRAASGRRLGWQPPAAPRIDRASQLFAQQAAWAVTIMGVLVMLTGLGGTSPLTGTGLVGLGLALWLSRQPYDASWRTPLARSLAMIIAVACGITFALLALGLSLDAVASLAGWRLPPPQTLAPLALAGLALFWIDRPSRPGLCRSEALAFLACLVPFLVLLGHLYDVTALFKFSTWYAVPAPIALSLLLLGLGILASRPERGVVRLALSESPGGLMLRRALPMVVLLPMGLGWLILTGERHGLMDAATGVTMLVTGLVVVASGLMWRHAASLNRAVFEREAAEARRIELEGMRQADAQKDQFLSILSHELRTPINAITGFGSILDDEVPGPLNAEQHRYLTRMLSASGMLLSLVNDLLDLSRIQAGRFALQPGDVRVAELVEEVLAILQPLAEQKRQALSAELAPDMPLIEADEQRVRQVLINLVGNAIKFTPPGGSVLVRVRPDGPQLLCEVEDTGPGIPAEAMPRLFKRFSQLAATPKVVGTGLGLSIAKALVEAHGGVIGVRSAVGEGSTFYFTLPLRAPEA